MNRSTVLLVGMVLLISACGNGRTVEVDPAPSNLPDLPDYDVEVCG